MKHLVVALFSALALSACANSNGTDVSYNDTPVCSVKSWQKDKFPLTIHIPDDLLSYSSAIENAGATWNNALRETLNGRDAFVFAYDNTPNTQWTTPTASLMDSILGFYLINDFNYPNVDNNVLAFTSTQCQNSKIINADILFNNEYNYGNVDTNPGRVDFESVLAHEMGHFLGLNHVDETASIMYPSIGLGSKKRSLSQSDLNRIKALYQ